MATVKDAHKFLGTEVVKWSRKGFINHFSSRFENAAEIYDYYKPKKAKKVEAEKED
jgi:hypothetical protein